MPDAFNKVPKHPPEDPNSPPERVDLSGVTFQGKQLSAQQLEERERRSEYMEEHRKEIADNVVILRRRHVKAKGNQEETKKVSRRAKRYTANEIREEYGIMQKPYNTKTENILWCIVNKGPIDLLGIAKALGLPNNEASQRKLSGPISHIFRCLGTRKPYGFGWIVRKPEGGRYFYKMEYEGLDKSVEVLFDKFREISAIIYRDKIAKKKGEPADPAPTLTQDEDQAPDTDIETKPYTTVNLEDIQDTIRKSVVDAVARTLGIKLEVSGKIEILFGFKGKD